MTTPPKTKSHFEQLLSQIYARGPHKNNKKVCIDCLKPRSNKSYCGCNECYLFDYQNYSFEIMFSL